LQVSAFSSSWGVLFLLSATRARLVSVVAQLEQLALDANEFNHLRLLSLMKAQHQQIAYPCQPLRYISCMVLLETMPQFESILLELYFKQSIGNASMSALISDILIPKTLKKSEKSG
uniref:Uncharacterized protein n=1 Tax=Parascaris equorum TaxID=6256 RepID=A0A914RYZ3_PAREQ